MLKYINWFKRQRDSDSLNDSIRKNKADERTKRTFGEKSQTSAMEEKMKMEKKQAKTSNSVAANSSCEY